VWLQFDPQCRACPVSDLRLSYAMSVEVLWLFSLVLTKFVFSMDLARVVCEWLQGEVDDILESPVQKTRKFMVQIVLPR
jgi:hypothetical protein